MKSVYCAVRNWSLNKAVCASSLNGCTSNLGAPKWILTQSYEFCKANLFPDEAK